MKRDWISATAAGLIGTVLVSIGAAGLFHHAIRGGILFAVGVFMLLSAYTHAGLIIKNPVVKRVQVFMFVVVACALLVAVTAGLALATQTGVWAFEKMIAYVRENFWTASLLLLSLCWLFIFRQPKPKRF
jgi:hypothetical protein